MKIFERHVHPEHKSDCLVGVTGAAGDSLNWLRHYSPGVYVAPDSGQMYVLVKPPEGIIGEWKHPEHGEVELWNTHGTGELRWKESIGKSFTTMTSDCLLAAQHFKISMRDATDKEWKVILDNHMVKKDDLSEIELGLLETASRVASYMTIIIEEKVKLLSDDGKEWHHTIRNPPEGGAARDLGHKGLLSFYSESSGTGTGQGRHIFRVKKMWKITERGRKVLVDGIG